MLSIDLRAGAAAAMAFAGGQAIAQTDPAAELQHVSCRGEPNEIRINVPNVDQSVGLIIADLYRNDEEGFLKRAGRVQQVRFAAKSPLTYFCLQAPEPGPYAIAIYHDENANKTFDKKAFGLPAEPYGISNNPRFIFAPPSLKDALFEVAKEGATVEIRLKN